MKHIENWRQSGLLKEIAGISGQSIQIVEFSIEGYYKKIRDIPAFDAKRMIQVVVTELAEQYGARSDVPLIVLKESVNLIGFKFSHLGLNEIREAYRLWAAGDLEKTETAEMYGGQFNAAQIGKVLGAYVRHRQKALAAYLKMRDELKLEAEEKRLREEKKQEYENNFDKYLAECKAEDWRDVPFHWYDTAARRGLIHFEEGEQKQIYEDALKLAHLEMEEKAEKVNELGGIKAVLAARKLADQLKPDSVNARAVIIAKKLTLFRKLIKQTHDSP